MANADSTAQTPGGDPYRRKIVTFTSELDRSLDANVVKLGHVESDLSDFQVSMSPAIRPPTRTATSNIRT